MGRVSVDVDERTSLQKMFPSPGQECHPEYIQRSRKEIRCVVLICFMCWHCPELVPAW